MSLRHLHYFLAAAEEQHFGRAAERLRISQPAMSRQILNMESEMGIALFERRPRGVRLSKAGEIFLQHAQQIGLAYERACAYARDVARGEVGRLRVGFTDFSLSYECVAASFRRYRATSPGVNLELAVTWSSVLQRESILNESIDGGFLYYFDGTKVDELEYLDIGEEKFLLALTPSHPFSSRRKIPVALLNDQPFVWVKRDVLPDHYDQLMAACRRSGLNPHIVQDGPTEASLLRLVSVEMGMALVRSSLATQLPEGIILRPVSGLSLSVKFGFARRRDNLSPTLVDLVKLLLLLMHESRGSAAI